jgi:hypothetical protein
MARVLALCLLLAASGASARPLDREPSFTVDEGTARAADAAADADAAEPPPPLLLLSRPLPLFSALDLGAGCWPLALHVAPGGAAPALELSGGDADSVRAADAAIAADVSPAGVLSLRVRAPGFGALAPGRGAALRVTLRVPDGHLAALSTGGGAAAVLVSAATASDFVIAGGASGAPVVLRRAADAAGLGTAGTLVLTVTQGTQPVALCSAVPQALSLVSVTNNAQADVRVDNFSAPAVTLRATGGGALYFFPGAPVAATTVLHSGAGAITLTGGGGGGSVTLQQTGGGALYAPDVARLSGRLSGAGNVYVGAAAASTVLTTGRGQVLLTDAQPPPPRVGCDTLPEPSSADAVGRGTVADARAEALRTAWHALPGGAAVRVAQDGTCAVEAASADALLLPGALLAAAAAA